MFARSRNGTHASVTGATVLNARAKIQPLKALDSEGEWPADVYTRRERRAVYSKTCSADMTDRDWGGTERGLRNDRADQERLFLPWRAMGRGVASEGPEV